jgi:hypothetical protein
MGAERGRARKSGIGHRTRDRKTGATGATADASSLYCTVANGTVRHGVAESHCHLFPTLNPPSRIRFLAKSAHSLERNDNAAQQALSSGCDPTYPQPSRATELAMRRKPLGCIIRDRRRIVLRPRQLTHDLRCAGGLRGRSSTGSCLDRCV